MKLRFAFVLLLLGLIFTGYSLFSPMGNVAHAQPPGVVALAFIDADGNVVSGSSNVTSRWDEERQLYEIDIAGVNYIIWNFVTVVTPTLGGEGDFPPLTPYVSSVDGKLLIQILNLAGRKTQSRFQFVTYRP